MHTAMLILLALVVGYPLWAFATWVLFCAVMMLKQRRDTLPAFARAAGDLVLLIGLFADAVLNLWSSILFLELPREALLTARVRRLKGLSTWRGAIARWLCDNLLCSIEPGHCG